ncbi:alpha/beta fold hydrolase [Agromyces bauzanensis]
MNRLRSRAARRTSRSAAAAASAVLMLALAACTGTSAPPRGDVADTFDIGGGRHMYLECRGSGEPTVVLVSGQRGSAEDWSITTEGPASDAVFPQLAEHTRVCAYDRPGTPVGMEFSRSDPAPQPTTVADMVADLHALLDASGEAGPYVMVGHSAGGLAARLFAATSPRDVVGLVLVDALSPGLQDAETAEEWAIQRVLLVGDIEESLVEYPDLEQVDVDASFAQMRAAPPLHPMPLVVISADHAYGPLFPELIASGQVPPGIPEDFGYVLDEAQRESQAGLARLLPDAEHLTKTDSGHAVHQEQPLLVADAILEVVRRVRG